MDQKDFQCLRIVHPDGGTTVDVGLLPSGKGYFIRLDTPSVGVTQFQISHQTLASVLSLIMKQAGGLSIPGMPIRFALPVDYPTVPEDADK